MKTSARKIFKETKPISSTKIFAFNKTRHILNIYIKEREGVNNY